MLRAFHEAGVKVDLVAGVGMGAVTAMFAAIDGGSRLWDPKGLWRRRGLVRYAWRRPLVIGGWIAAALIACVLAPVAFVLIAGLLYPVAFFLNLDGLQVGRTLSTSLAAVLAAAFEPGALPTFVPRAAFVMTVALLVALLVGALQARRRSKRRERGAIWWRAIAEPLDVTPAANSFLDTLWQLIRGAAGTLAPSPGELSEAYSELLSENLGQPGFRELIVTVHDLDARRDLVFALLTDPHRRRFFARRPGPDGDRRYGEIADLAAAGRVHAVDALLGALRLPGGTDPHFVTFSAEGPWRGEIHRVGARPDAVGRVLHEIAIASVEQVVVASSVEELAGPHGLTAARRDARGQLGETLAAMEAAAIRDALAAEAKRFKRAFLIRPAHNAVGPLDFDGSYDDRSDRVQRVGELVDRGYEDAYRQFIDPVVGAGGERLEIAREGAAEPSAV
ncbi:MAG: hypothetical protein HYX76_04315 [Acidobacteria bacterium]|nr:hypothetical protein [Acidobacteriota bacterium]